MVSAVLSLFITHAFGYIVRLDSFKSNETIFHVEFWRYSCVVLSLKSLVLVKPVFFLSFWIVASNRCVV